MNTLSMPEFMAMLPLILPIIIIQLILMIVAIVKISQQQTFRYLNKGAWLVIVIVFQLVGPACYFIFGRGED